MSDYDFEPGKRYDFHLTNGIVYIGATYIRGTPINGIRISLPGLMGRITIKPEHYDWAEDYDPKRSMLDIFK